MLDKTVEFHSIIMRHPNDKPPMCPNIPEGFSVRFYQKGDEQYWADIQVAVLEFPNREEALKCYDYYWQYMDELEKRQLFIIDNTTRKPVATANAWWTDVYGQKSGVVFGLSCFPEYQSKGLGRIVTSFGYPLHLEVQLQLLFLRHPGSF